MAVRPTGARPRQRTTKETSIEVAIDLDGGDVAVATGLPFFDHMLDQLGRHGGLRPDGRRPTATCTSTATTPSRTPASSSARPSREALGDKAGVARFASGLFPLDEALVEVALDLSGRPFVVWDVPFGEVLPLGDPPFNPEMAGHFWQSFATAAGITLHVAQAGRREHPPRGRGQRSRASPAACASAVRVEGTGVPSTKGVL